MARPRKKTLEFFMHDINARHDLKIRALERRHGNDGYAVYFKLLEMCGGQDGMRLSLQSPLVLEQVIEETRVRDEAHLYGIIQTCCEVGLFDAPHWQSERIVFSNGLYKRYIGRLEERRQSAERKRRQREAENLQIRISELEQLENNKNQNPTQDPENRNQISDPDPEIKYRSQISDPDPDPDRASATVTRSHRVVTRDKKRGERNRIEISIYSCRVGPVSSPAGDTCYAQVLRPVG